MNNPSSKFRSTVSGSLSAFTLVELLISIAVLAVLVTLGVSATSAMRESGRNAKCVSNLRNIGAAFTSFINENNGLYPDIGVWNDALLPYTSKQTFICPSAAHTEPMEEHIKSGAIFNDPEVWAGFKAFISYGYNAYFSPTGSRGVAYSDTETKWKAITPFSFGEPGIMILVADCAKYVTETSPGSGWFQVEDWTETNGRVAPRHRKKANILYADGHVGATPYVLPSNGSAPTEEEQYMYLRPEAWTGRGEKEGWR
jgi:prepilin-type processing-associated H-X9-DG protein/prepilin-type N-terminal cleavage/methylation domain-containing protein